MHPVTTLDTYELYPHQELAAQWLAATTKGGLWDEQGLGKTATSIAAFDLLGAEKVLVLAPVVVAHNWAREVARWSPRRKCQVVVSGGMRVDPLASVVITTHALLLSPRLRAQLLALRWCVVIIDEAHAMKNPSAQRTQHAYTLRPGMPSVTAQARYVWLLTGTPVPNDPSELWTHLYALAPERLYMVGTTRPMNWAQFRDRFCAVEITRYGVRVIGTRNEAELRARMRGFALRRLKTDHLALPPVLWGTVAITGTLGPELLALETKLRGGVPEREDVEFGTWRRLCGLAKAPAAATLLADELAGGAKIVVFAHHTEVLSILQARLAAYAPVMITGAQSALERSTAVEKFQVDPLTRVALCNIVAGGVGITLTASSQVVFVESSFVPGENAQAADRVHRIGQYAETVTVRVLALAGSVDELVASATARKAAMIRTVIK